MLPFIAIMILIQVISVVGYLHFERDNVRLYFQSVGLFSFSILGLPLLYIS